MTLGPAYGDGFAGVANYGEESALYIKGDNDTDGSYRFILNEEGEVIRAQRRVGGIWIAADIEHGIGTWVIDDDLGEIVLDEEGDLVLQG